MGKIVGIDLGTTNSVVAIMEGGEVKVISSNKQGGNLTPSVIGFTETGERLVGNLAKRQAIINPRNTVYSIKRFMGRRRNEVGQEEKMFPYEIVGNGDDPVRVKIRDKFYTPQEISAMILSDLKETAETYLGEKVTEAVITCPAYFNDSQRQATIEAGRIAGFDVKRVINEPTAAALAYGLDKKKGVQKIAVYDLGGGTFDISILEVDNNAVQVLSTNGNTHLGGDDFDHILINYVADEFKKTSKVDLRKDPMAVQRLKEACERAKCELSSMLETEINLPFIAQDASKQPLNLAIKLTRSKFEQLIGDLVESSLKPVADALKDAKLDPSQLNEIVLVGGSTRIPLVQKLVKDYFKKEPNRSVNPDEIVAVGAAVQGAVLKGDKDILLLDVTPLTLGLKVEGGLLVPLIKRNSAIPTQAKQKFSTAQDGQPAVTIEVFQGERPMADDNRKLGNFDLDGIPPAPRGKPQIEVSFDLDSNGMLKVTAKDLGTGKQQEVSIKGSTGLSEDEVKKMVGDAEKYGDADKKRREVVEARNHAEHLVYTTEKFIKEQGDKLPAGDKEKINAALENLKKVREGDDVAAIKKSMEEVATVSQEYGKKLYEEAAKANPEAAAGGPAPTNAEGNGNGNGNGAGKAEGNKEKVIDAEFESK